MDYVKSWIPDQRVAILAGNSVHVDKLFLMEGMPDLIDHLHYRYVCTGLRYSCGHTYLIACFQDTWYDLNLDSCL